MRYMVGGHTNEANTEHTHMLSGGRRGGGVFSGERSGGGSHWREWRGSSMLSGSREKVTAEEIHGKTVKYHIASATAVLQDFDAFFSLSLVFNMFFTYMLVEVKLNGI